MSRLGAWFRGAAPQLGSNSAPSQADLRARRLAALESAIASTSLIMNDDIDGAEKGLREGDSPFHLLGLGICTFMRSILGFEKEIMLEASNRLTACENAAWNELRKAQREAKPGEDRIYPPGSEYALVIADAQLMSAIIAVLHESLTEALRGFYKLRKAFMALDEIMQAETAYLKKKGLHSSLSLSNGQAATSSTSTPNGRLNGTDDTDTDLEFVDADEAHSGGHTPLNYAGHLAKNSIPPEEQLSQLSLDSNSTKRPASKRTSMPLSSASGNPDSDIFKDPVDIFIHSGVNMCFGSLLLLLSMVPPTFSRLLSIIGFKGDRERGINMLWQSSKFDNINGAVAGLMLLSYYNGLLSFADILPSEEDVEKGAFGGYPKARCSALLVQMRSRYPDSGLWRFEEARVLGNSRDLHGALKILKENRESKMRQVTALNNFEMALSSMFIHDYDDMRDNFLRCVELNDWSPSLYYYIAGCAELENYRNAFHSKEQNESQINVHKKKADELLRKAPTLAGKKRFLARPLPFEQFVSRKLQKWEERSKALGVDLVDAVGVSPAQEMTFLWNGTRKMQTAELKMSEKALSWDRLTASEEARKKIKEEIDEQASRDVCRAAVERELGNLDSARELLDSVLAMDKLAFRGTTKDDYALPAAHYEMAALAWIEVQKPALRGQIDEDDEEDWLHEKVEECQSWLDKVAKWEAFVLDARIGMRVQTGMDTITWYKKEHGWTTA
ncbi:uncharacterized protein GGS22DRAFT_42366 [Annulohypoxylon maeteangense]|uniref:uncharacterized protein n=1 Tax=Annulohypoxylon maeteangense TaxID=1927788 RepID=UPI0020077D21|nr:uncharacterized protein GGS22DRAFT_42366 [Annulohypoxylon maeteangense]KAI0882919.1 hypothetical protein GGS22DRAFT_42366 [Annulohypoxylon maeteangense]